MNHDDYEDGELSPHDRQRIIRDLQAIAQEYQLRGMDLDSIGSCINELELNGELIAQKEARR